MTVERWNANPELLGKLTEQDLKFIFDQAEKKLKDSLDTAGIIATRLSTLVTIISGILVALTGFMIARWDNYHQIDAVFTTSIVLGVYFLILAALVVTIVQPSLYKVLGSAPRELFLDSFFSEKIKDSERILRYYYCEIVNYQERIELNEIRNIRRWKMYEIALWAIVLSPLIFIITFFLITR